MTFVSRVAFEPKPLLNKSEQKVLVLLESFVRTAAPGHRVMAQTSMGEIMRPKVGSGTKTDCDLAYRAINSKRLDFLIVDPIGMPIVAVEYQGQGHYQGDARLRDAVKHEALRLAHITLIEIPADYEPKAVARAVRRALESQTRLAASS